MMKVLTKISALEAGKVSKIVNADDTFDFHVKPAINISSKQSCGKMCVLDMAALESLCLGSSGDIRSALNSLQFMSFPGVPSHQTRCRSYTFLF